MSAAQATMTLKRSGPGWLLLGSLALNLFFVGVAVAMALRGPPHPHWNRDVFVRVGWIADTLPSADASILRDGMQAHHAAIEKAQDEYYGARNQIRAVLRQEPFKPEDMRAAMVKTRAARQTYDQMVQEVFADAAAKMSPAGRIALADWRKPNDSKSSKRDRH